MTEALGEAKVKISSNFLPSLKFEMSPCSLYGVLKTLREGEGARGRERQQKMQREGCECGKSNFCAQ